MEIIMRRRARSESQFEQQLDQAGTLSGVDASIAHLMCTSGDGSSDKISVSKASVAAAALKPSQTTMVLEKAVGMALGMLAKGKIGGDLNALISADNYIMDGHHRWAAAIIAGGSSAKVEGYKAALKGEELLKVLNILTVGKFNVRNGKPGKGSLSMFTPKNIADLLEEYSNNGVPGDFPIAPEKVQEIFVKNFGSVEDAIITMAGNIKSMNHSVPSWAPDRKEMPVIDPDKGHVEQAVKALSSGDVDWAPPYKQAAFRVTASQRNALIRLASNMPVGSAERRAILSVVKR
jgi:hypothetical protein